MLLEIELTLSDFDECETIASAFEDWLDERGGHEGYEVDIKEQGEFVVTDVEWPDTADVDAVQAAVREWAADHPVITNVAFETR